MPRERGVRNHVRGDIDPYVIAWRASLKPNGRPWEELKDADRSLWRQRYRQAHPESTSRGGPTCPPPRPANNAGSAPQATPDDELPPAPANG